MSAIAHFSIDLCFASILEETDTSSEQALRKLMDNVLTPEEIKIVEAATK